MHLHVQLVLPATCQLGSIHVEYAFTVDCISQDACMQRPLYTVPSQPLVATESDLRHNCYQRCALLSAAAAGTSCCNVLLLVLQLLLTIVHVK